MLKSLLAASAITFAAVTSASAGALVSPAAASAAVNADRAQSSVIVDAQYIHGQRDSRRVRQHHRSQRYVPGRRYSRAPRGWRRHAARPWNWQTRGCIVVGAVWFCP